MPAMLNSRFQEQQSLQNEDQRESYFYSLLLLFVPFREKTSLLLEQGTAEEAFKCLLPANVECSAHHARLQAMLKVQENLKAITNARTLSPPEEHSDNKSDDEPQLMGEAKAAMQDVQEMIDSSDDDITLDERVQMLNVDQKRIYEEVKMHMFICCHMNLGSAVVTLNPSECL